ncbi:MAG: hypothetical protein ACJ763_18475 [Bdellovibrionia bacterium]
MIATEAEEEFIEDALLTSMFSGTEIDLLPGSEAPLWQKPELYRRLTTQFEGGATLIGFDKDHQFFFGVKEFTAVIIPVQELEKIVFISSIDRTGTQYSVLGKFKGEAISSQGGTSFPFAYTSNPTQAKKVAEYLSTNLQLELDVVVESNLY